MTIQLPALINAYFLAANRHDIASMLAPFADDALVQDEGEQHVGHAAIRAWMDRTTQKYKATVEPRECKLSDGKTTVTGSVTGNFPGSPATLRYGFILSSSEIHRLEIG